MRCKYYGVCGDIYNCSRCSVRLGQSDTVRQGKLRTSIDITNHSTNTKSLTLSDKEKHHAQIAIKS